MKVLVTGGTGFIGSTLVRHLLVAGHDVKVLVRQKKDSFLLENLSVEVVNGDVTNLRAVEKAVEGCSVVFNLASLYAFYPFWIKQPRAIYKINVKGTVNMLEASLKYGVQKFIHTSTIATLNANPPKGLVDESTGFEPRGASHYARSKYFAEQEVLKYCKRGLSAVILNPAVVIGERDHKPTPSGDVIVKFLNKSYPGYFDSLWSVADADDVARAHLAAVERGRNGERYILANKQHYTLKEIFQLLEKITGIRAPRLRIPYGCLLGFTYLDEVMAHFVFRKKPLMPTEGVKFCRTASSYDNSKAVRELGYVPTPFEETLSKAVAWYRKNAYVEPHGVMRIKARGFRFVRWIMQKLRMDKFTDKLNPGTVIFFGIVKSLELLRKAGMARQIDGWRKVTQCYLRTEPSKFALSVFALDFWSDQTEEELPKNPENAKRHLLQRLAKFLKGYPVFQTRLEWKAFSARRRFKGPIDIVEAQFDESGALRGLTPWLDQETEHEESKPVPDEVKEILLSGVRQVYNAVKDQSDKKRPRNLKKEWSRWFSKHRHKIPPVWRGVSWEYAERVLSATYIRFEGLSPSSGFERFKVPRFIKSKHPGYGILNIVARLTEDLCETDLWIEFSHIPIDGVPAQEVLNDLKKKWGVRRELRFPSDGQQKQMLPEKCSTAGGRSGVFHVYQFLDFRPFLKVRSELNRRFGRRARQVVSSAALLIWKLAQYKEFEDIKFAVPVDLRTTPARERTLGFIFIRPNAYFDRRRPDRGFFEFQQEFNRQLFATRKRTSEGYRLLEAYAVAAPCLYAATAKFLRNPLNDFVGTLGITIIKKADFFVAPASDVHTNGFIAFSNFLLPAENGGNVCVVSIKGPREKVRKYVNVLQDVMHRAIQHDELYF